MAEPNPPLPLTISRAEQIFPAFTSAQIARIAKRGRSRTVRSGEVLVEQGDKDAPHFVVLSGKLEAVRPTAATERLLFIVTAGQFTGEVNTLSGRRAMARIRARQDGNVIQLTRQSFLALLQADAELSEILMRAFILRRAPTQPVSQEEAATHGVSGVMMRLAPSGGRARQNRATARRGDDTARCRDRVHPP